MNQRCVSINVFLSPSWWESYIAANFVLGSFLFFSFLHSWLGGMEGKWFQHLSNTFLSDWLGAFSDMVDHSQEAQFQPEQADKGHWKTIHSDYVGAQSHMDLNHMSIKAGLPSLTLCDLMFKYCYSLRTAAGTSHRWAWKLFCKESLNSHKLYLYENFMSSAVVVAWLQSPN